MITFRENGDGRIRAVISSVVPSKLAALASTLSNNGFRKSGSDHCGAVECLPNVLEALEGVGEPFELEQIIGFLKSEIAKCNERYAATIERIERLEKVAGIRLWDYQVQDVLKMSEARASLNASGCGLGKLSGALPTGAWSACFVTSPLRSVSLPEPRLQPKPRTLPNRSFWHP